MYACGRAVRNASKQLGSHSGGAAAEVLARGTRISSETRQIPSITSSTPTAGEKRSTRGTPESGVALFDCAFARGPREIQCVRIDELYMDSSVHSCRFQ